MTTPRTPRIDAWVFPPGTSAPTVPPAMSREDRELPLEHHGAGTVTIRYPKSDHHLAHSLISALRSARTALAALATTDLITLLGSVGERFTRALDDATIAEIAANSGLSSGHDP